MGRLPQQLEHIPRQCFVGCTALSNIPIPPFVRTVGLCAFLDCTSLSSMDLPELVSAIGKYAFDSCTSLRSITIRSSASSSTVHFGKDLFCNCPLLSTIRLHPYLWPKLFAAMNKNRAFLFLFFRKYHTTMFDEAERVYRRRHTRRVITENQDFKNRCQPLLLQAKQMVIDEKQARIDELERQVIVEKQARIDESEQPVTTMMMGKKISCNSILIIDPVTITHHT